MALLRGLVLCLFILTIRPSNSDDDILLPYKVHHGPVHRRLQDTKQCQHNRYGNTTYSLHTAHVNQSEFDHIADVHHKLTQVGKYVYMKRNIVLRYQRVYNPERTLSVLEPGHRGSCDERSGVRASVQETANQHHCLVATNAGFFNTHTGECLGNIVSDGRLVQDSGGIQNVHFGITKDGHIFTGYLSEIELVTLQFRQLVGGVVWLLRDGKSYVDESRNIECPDTQETGTLDRFIGVVSARTAVGHDAQGRVLMVQVDGKTDQRGVDLHEFASLLKDLGFVNAINLDGGGSATTVVNGTLVNYPSDVCVNSRWNCGRAVSTILCVHLPHCTPHPDCSDHGRCVSSVCQCHSPWSGDACDVLACPNDCSGHGLCVEDGCECEAGWKGENCSLPCEEGRFGVDCVGMCQCVNNATCQRVSGMCQCPPGFTGTHCEHECGYGWYGDQCQQQCQCSPDCFCHHVTGVCSNTSHNADYLAVAQCVITAEITNNKLVPDQTEQLVMWKWVAASSVIILIISLGINAFFIIALCRHNNQVKGCQVRCYPLRSATTRKAGSTEFVPLRYMNNDDDSSFVDSSTETDQDTVMTKKKLTRLNYSAKR